MSMDPNDFSSILAAVTKMITATGDLKISPLPDDDFYDAGVTSVMALPILLDLEDHFGVSIPDDRFIAARSPRSVAELIVDLKQ